MSNFINNDDTNQVKHRSEEDVSFAEIPFSSEVTTVSKNSHEVSRQTVDSFSKNQQGCWMLPSEESEFEPKTFILRPFSPVLDYGLNRSISLASLLVSSGFLIRCLSPPIWFPYLPSLMQFTICYIFHAFLHFY